MYLVYINKVGDNWINSTVYEFLFAENIDDVDGIDWDMYPAAGQPRPPDKALVNAVGILNSELELDLIQESDSFAVWDAVDGLISLGWENLSNHTEYPDNRLHFRFGEEMTSVRDKLYEMDMILSITELDND